jgi:hypothetical protein
LRQQVARLVRGALARELSDRGRVGLHLGKRPPQRPGEAVRDDEALARQADGGPEQSLPGKLAALLPRQVETGDRAGDAHRNDRIVVQRLVVAARAKEHRGLRRSRGLLAEVVGRGLAAGAEDEKAAAADVAGLGMDDGKS